MFGQILVLFEVGTNRIFSGGLDMGICEREKTQNWLQLFVCLFVCLCNRKEESFIQRVGQNLGTCICGEGWWRLENWPLD